VKTQLVRKRLWGLTLLGTVLAACSQTGSAGPGATGDDPPPGVTDTEIKLGSHMPLSQSPAAAYAPIADGMRAYFEFINDTEGGVHGRKIDFIVGDDHYAPMDTLEVVRRLVEEDQVFAIVAGLGDATHLTVWKYLEERGVPDLFISSGLARWTDPVVPTRFGGNPVYLQEGEMLGRYIAGGHDGKKLGLLIQSDEVGTEGEAGIRAGLEGSDVEIVAVETYDPANLLADVTGQTQRLKNAGAEVIAAYALPPQAASLVKTARQVLNWDVPVVVTGVVATDIFIQLAGAENAEGVVSVVFGHQVDEVDNPGVRRHREIMATYAGDVQVSNLTLYGAAMAELTVEGLKRAGRDLTRSGLIEALESIRDVQCDVCLAPISLGPDDHRPVEIEMYVRVEDARWVPFGEPVSLESTAP
jgi:ABC-type branched-subunit amino acid transport system substrate-binding protein